MATAVDKDATAQEGRRRILRHRGNELVIRAKLWGAGLQGTIPQLTLGERRTLAKAVVDAANNASNEDLDKFIDYARGGQSDGEELFKEKVMAALGENGGPFIDIIIQLLPVLLPLLVGCLGG